MLCVGLAAPAGGFTSTKVLAYQYKSSNTGLAEQCVGLAAPAGGFTSTEVLAYWYKSSNADAAPAVVDNFRAIPAAEYRHFGYCSR